MASQEKALWDPFVLQIQHTFDVNSNQWIVINVCKEAAIFGLDSTIWAKSKGIELKTYECDVP